MKRGGTPGGNETPKIANIQDKDIHILPEVLDKLPYYGVDEARVRDKVRHLIYHVGELGLCDKWELLFADHRKQKRLLAGLQANPGNWRAAFDFRAPRTPSDLNGIVYLRKCIRSVLPTPEFERKALENGKVRTEVELAFHVEPRTNGRHVVKVFRFSEVPLASDRELQPHLSTEHQ